MTNNSEGSKNSDTRVWGLRVGVRLDLDVDFELADQKKEMVISRCWY